MEYRLIKYELDSPIERIRGSEAIRITIRATYKASGLEYVVPGLAITKSDSFDGLNTGISSALENAEANFKTLMSKAGTFNKSLSSFIKGLLQPTIEEHTKKAVDTINNDPKVLDKDKNISRLQGPADEIRQTKVNELCDVLGIEPITVLEEWSMIEALALIEELKLKTQRFEGK